MFTWALNVECRKLNVDEHSTLNIQRSTPKAPLHPGSWKATTSISTRVGTMNLIQVGTALRRRPRSATDGRWFGRTSASRTRTAAERRPYLDWVHGKNSPKMFAH